MNRNGATATAQPGHIQLRGTIDIQAAEGKRKPRFSLVANTGQAMEVPGWTWPVVLDLAGVTFDKQSTPVIADHNTSLRIGHTDRQRVDGSGVYVEGPISSSSKTAKGVLADAKEGYPFQASVGADIPPDARRFVAEGETVNVNGREHSGPLLLAERSVIKEISIVVLGADNQTSLAIAARAKLNNGAENMVEKTSLELEREAVAAEEERVDRIKAVFKQYSQVESVTPEGGSRIKATTFKRNAIVKGYDANDVELTLMRASRQLPEPVQVHVTGGNYSQDSCSNLLQAALLTRSGHGSLAEKELGPQTMQAANDMGLRSASLVDLCRHALVAEGIQPTGGPDGMIRAALSTNTMTTALGGSVDKLAGHIFQNTSATWRSIAAIRPLTNFREHTLISPLHRGDLDLVSDGASIGHEFLGEDTSTIKAETYAKQVAIGRQALRNDDLGLLEDVIPVFVRHAARKMSDLFWTTVLANGGSHYSSGNSNLLEAGSDLDETSLALAVQTMRKQADADGHNLDIEPTTLAVPPELELTARKLLNSSEIEQDTAGEPRGNVVPSWNLRLEVEPRLSNANFSGYSATAWYLFGPMDQAPAYVGLLDGYDGPHTEFFDLASDPNHLSVSWRVWIDAGCALGEHRSSVKATGAGE